LCEDVKNTINLLRKQDKGADWVNANCAFFVKPNKNIPSVIYSSLQEMVKTRTNKLYIQREATYEEKASFAAMNGRQPPNPYYVSEFVSDISGLSSLYLEKALLHK